MRISEYNFLNRLRFTAVLGVIALSGCGNSCFVGISNNGNGVVIIKAANPPPSCSLSQGNGMMSVTAVKSAICEGCTAAARVEHVFVSVRGVQLRGGASGNANSGEWVEVAPQLAKEPRQIDLMGQGGPEILVDRVAVAAGSYREVRLQFLGGEDKGGEGLRAENACGEAGWNCAVRGDGRVEAIELAGEVPEVVISSERIEGNSVLVLPDGRMVLQARIEPSEGDHFSSGTGWTRRVGLLGRATVVRQR